MPTKYEFARLTPSEFSKLLRKAGLKLNDFLFLTGRNSHQVTAFLSSDGSKQTSYRPTMGDVLLLEMVVRDPSLFDVMCDINNSYSTGGTLLSDKSSKEEVKPKTWAKPTKPVEVIFKKGR